MRNIFISVLFITMVSACAKKEDSSPAGHRKATFLRWDGTLASPGPCSVFDSGAKLTSIERIGMAGYIGDIQVYTKGYSPNQPIEKSSMAGLLLHFDRGQPFLLQVRGTTGDYPSESDLMTAINQLTMLNSNSSTIKVSCIPSTRYFTKGDLSDLHYMDRWESDLNDHQPNENSESNLDGIITIENIGFQ